MQSTSINAAASASPGISSTRNRLEQVFLEEMLKYAGPKSREGDFSGGHGEEQFFTFMNREYAAVLAHRLDLGLGNVK